MPGTNSRRSARILNFAEEIYLLALDDQSGAVNTSSPETFDYLLAGALLMDLALQNRLDTDLVALRLVATSATGDPLLDETIRELQLFRPSIITLTLLGGRGSNRWHEQLPAACLFDAVFTPDELARVKERIAMLAKLDLIGQAVAKSIREIEDVMTQTMNLGMSILMV